MLAAELSLPIKFDWCALECAMGVNHSMDEIWTRIRQVTDRAGQLLQEYQLSLAPMGATPNDQVFLASHVHIGTVANETDAIHLENQVLRYVPAFGALAANSPSVMKRSGEYKSYRVKYQAHGMCTPSPVRDPGLSQDIWGLDAGPKLAGHSTMEVRIVDCATSRRLLAEMATFIAAYMHERGTRVTTDKPTTDQYREAMLNRYAAAKHGLQATFIWDGQPKPVTEVLEEMLEYAAPGLSKLGASLDDLGIIQKMLQKRTCQADFALGYLKRFPDTMVMQSVFSKMVRHWTVFEEFLEKAPVLDPEPALDEDAILAEHLRVIGEGTHFYRTRQAMNLPPPAADDVLRRLEEQGLVRREVASSRGTVLTRIS